MDVALTPDLHPTNDTTEIVSRARYPAFLATSAPQLRAPLLQPTHLRNKHIVSKDVGKRIHKSTSDLLY